MKCKNKIWYLIGIVLFVLSSAVSCTYDYFNPGDQTIIIGGWEDGDDSTDWEDENIGVDVNWGEDALNFGSN